MKKILFLALAICALAFMLVSCDKGTEGLEFIEINDGEYGVKCGEAVNEGEIVIPSKHDGKIVTTILSSGFLKCEKLTSITIPKSITKIEKGAFYGCDSLESVYYKGKIKGWCNIEFEHSTSNPMSVAKNFYSKNTLANEIKISGTDKINAYAFFGFECLNKVTIKDVTAIGDSAFAGCSSLSSITLPSGLTSIGKLVFSGCVKLNSLTIPSSVTIIHPLAFYECTGLKSVAFEDNENWFLAKKETDTKGNKVVVTDPAQNAKALVKSHAEFWKHRVISNG